MTNHIRPKVRSKESIRQELLEDPKYEDLRQRAREEPFEDENEDEDKPLVLGSLAELLDRAGHMPNSQEDLNQEGNIVEADLSFQCVAQEEYSSIQEEVFLGIEDPLGDDDDDSEDDEGLADLFGATGDDEEDAEIREPRLFYKVWTLLSQWMTPQAASYIQKVRDEPHERIEAHYTVHESDIVASRCSGLIAMLKMHLPRVLSDLGIDAYQTRDAETKMADLLRCFQYSRPMALKLDIKSTRALTCILIATLMKDEAERVPESCKALGMEWDEYRYLTRSSFKAFHSDDIVHA